MPEYKVAIHWQLDNEADFLKSRYSRGHSWKFDGGINVPASSSPHVVPLPMSVEEAVDPEEAFIASVASCHMLWFLSIAAGKGFAVKEYVDEAVGVMGKNSDGKMAVTSITLSPKTRFEGQKTPAPPELESLHRSAHEKCFIANSIKSEIHCRPSILPAASQTKK
ncbi:MAG: OsmC family protein [Desulfosarcinaceae bacterium]